MQQRRAATLGTVQADAQSSCNATPAAAAVALVGPWLCMHRSKIKNALAMCDYLALLLRWERDAGGRQQRRAAYDAKTFVLASHQYLLLLLQQLLYTTVL